MQGGHIVSHRSCPGHPGLQPLRQLQFAAIYPLPVIRGGGGATEPARTTGLAAGNHFNNCLPFWATFSSTNTHTAPGWFSVGECPSVCSALCSFVMTVY